MVRARVGIEPALMLSTKRKRLPDSEIEKPLASGKWDRTTDIRNMSPLFYRLDYATVDVLIIA